jgi:hypothetical protein
MTGKRRDVNHFNVCLEEKVFVYAGHNASIIVKAQMNNSWVNWDRCSLRRPQVRAVA